VILERFTHLLDVYGGRLERWPEEERRAARTLLARSADARARAAAAGRLDALLDQIADPAPSAALVARVLAMAPARSAVRKPPVRQPWRVMITVTGGAAIAASLAFWLLRSPAPGTPLGASAIAQLGVLDTPTDVLLSDADLDLGGEVPEFGCDDPTVGCDETTFEPAERSGLIITAKEMPA
jgi:hypothetical protein